MQTISKSKLKPQMLRIFREIEENGEGVIITDRGRPTLKIEPIKPIAKKLSVEKIFGPDIQGKVIFHEDPNTPTIEEWEDV